MQSFRHILVVFLISIAAISVEAGLSPQYGGSGGRQNSFAGHGKITGIKYWGITNGHVGIHTLEADNQQYPVWFGPHYGSGCSAFQLRTGDEINGYRVYYDESGVYGLTFLTKYGESHSCSSSIAGKSDSGPIVCGGYLTALFANTDDFINRISFEFAGGNCPAQFSFQCDNQYWIHVSYDGGVPGNWQTLGSGNDWTQLSQYQVKNPGSQTLVDIWCQDNGGVGGFIATMEYNNNKYSTTKPLSNSKWHILGETAAPPQQPLTAVSASSLVYNAKGSGAWDGHVSSAIDSQAYWVWNGKVNNVLYWRVDFGSIIGDAVPNYEPPTNFYEPRNNYYNINAVQLILVFIGILVFVNILCVCYGACGKRKQFVYNKVKLENSDSEAI